MHGKRRHYRPMAHLINLLVLFLVATVVLSQGSSPDPTPTPLTTAEATDVLPTFDPSDPTPPPAEPEATQEQPTATVQPPVEPSVEATVEVTAEPTPETTPEAPLAAEALGDPIILPLAMQTFCEMEITDAGDSNAYTYGFNAINTNNIASYAWDFGDGTTSTAQSDSHTYVTAGSFSVTLVCTPNDGLPDLTLTGGVSISSGLTVNFTVTPATQFTGVPFTIVTVNNSLGNQLTYSWAISTDSDPGNTGAYIYTSTQENITYTFSDTGASLPLTLYVYLTATDSASNSSFASQSIVVLPPPPLADFSVTPIVGAAPLTVTVTGTDLLAGPITTVEWDTDGDFGTIEAIGFGPHNFTFSALGTYSITMRYTGPGLAPGDYNTVMRQVIAADSGIPVNADFTWEIIGPSGGGVEVCLTNTSTGPVATAEWDFGDGTPIVSSLDSVVCHVYANTNLYQVFLSVENAAATFSSQAAYFISVTQPPIASFTINPGSNITWGTLIDLTNTSTGVYDIIEWDLDGNGSYETTTANPSNIALSALGANPIRLRITDSASGMSSFAEAIVTVARLAVTCDIAGNIDVAPGSAAQVYTASATGLTATGFLSRTINYSWTVTGSGAGLPLSQPGNPLSIDWDTVGFGAFTVQLNGVTSDGAQCSDTVTVNHNFDALTCDIAITPSTPQYPDGENYTLSYTLSGTNGRTVTAVRWYQGIVPNPNPNNPGDWSLVGAGATFPFVNSSSTVGLPRTDNWRIEIDVDNTSVSPGYVPATTICNDTEQYTVQNWPTLTCDSISGDLSPLPVTVDDDTRSYSYTVNLGGLAGRTNIAYDWTVDANDGVMIADGVNPVQIRWTPAALDAGNESLSVVVTVTNPDGTNANCNVALTNTIDVQLPSLTCNTPIGDINPTVGETTDFIRDYTDDYGRTISAFSWLVAEVAPAVPLTYTPTTHPLFLTFDEPNAEYNLTYDLSVAASTVINPNTSLPYPGTLPADSCTSPALNVNTYGPDVSFECETAIFGDSTPFGASPNYTYSFFVDNTNLLDLHFVWTLTDYLGTNYVLEDFTGSLEIPPRTFDGMVYTAPFTLPMLAPLGVDNYLLTVYVEDADNLPPIGYSCTRSLPLTVGLLDAQYSYDAGIWTNTALPVGQQICFNDTTTWNPSKPTYATTEWTISGSAAANSLNTNIFDGATQCVSFNTPGTYNITIDQDVRGVRQDSFTRTFTVYGLQNIIANRTGSAFGNTLQSFTATGTNITAGTYNWTFFNSTTSQTLTRNEQNPALNLAPGVWTATVVGTGPLGDTQAQLNFTLEETGGLVARFTASQYTGVAPMNVCFTDNSVSSGSSISLWEWDLDGNGTYEISSPTQVNPCFDYPTPGVSTTVRLRVTNALFTRTATNTIRTYTLAEGQNNFSITPVGGGQYCFTAILAPGVGVVSWNFGDGSPTVMTNQTNICHSYSASGTYFVQMGIDVPGLIERPLIVPPTSGTPPVLAVSHVCTDGAPIFTVTNTGGDMTTPDVIQYYTMPGDILFATDSIQLAAGASQNFSPPTGSYVRFRTIDTALDDTAACVDLDVAAACSVNSLPIFTVTNSSVVPMTQNQPWEIRNAANTLITSGTFQIAGSGAFTDISVPAGNNPYDTYTFSTAGVYQTLTLAHNCAASPVITVTSVCGDPLVFTITNNGANMLVAQDYEVVEGATTITSGNFTLAAGGSTTVTLPTGIDPYLLYTLRNSGGFLTFTHNRNCADPVIQVTSVCGDPIVFTIRNTGGRMFMAQSYTVTQGATSITSGTFTLLAGASTTVTLPTGIDPYLPYVITTSGGFVTTVTYTHNCADPVLTVSSVCGDPIVFTVTNTGGAMLIAQPYTVTQGAATIVSSTYTVAANSSTTITLSGGLDPYLAYIFSSSGAFVTSLNTTHDCPEPVLSVSSVCGSPIVFTVTNTGGAMLIAQPYTVTQGATTVASGTYTVAANSTSTITLPGGLNPYLAYIFSSSGAFVTSLNTTHDCPEPVLTVTSVCGSPIVFTVTNTGADMLTPQAYTVTQGGSPVDSGTFTVAGGGATTTVTMPAGFNPYLEYVFSSSGFITVASLTHDCADPVITVTSVCGDPIVFTVTNTGADMLIAQPYTVTQGATTVASSTFNLAAGTSTTVTLPGGIDPYAAYVFSNNGGFITINFTHDCADTDIVVTSVCGDPIVFTVTNNGASTILAQNYAITQGAATITTGTLNLASGDSTTVTLPTGIDPYLPYVFSNTGGFITINFTHDCANPTIVVTSVCGNPIVFTVNNTGGDMLIDQPYTITQGATVITTGNLNLATGGSTTVTLPADIDPYVPYVFSNTGGFVTISYTHNCVDPVITVTSVCGNPIVFTVTNTGGDMFIPQTYTVSQGATVVDSGTIDLAAGGTTTITLTADINPYLPYVFSSSGAFVTVANFTHDCAEPVITVTSVCGNPIVFTVDNAGGAMLMAQPYTITQGATVVDSGTINIPAGDSTTITLLADINPYLPYVFSSSGAFVTVANYTHDCAEPVITVTSVCGNPIIFTVDNAGGAMLMAQSYTVTQGATVVASGTINIPAGDSTTVTLPADINPYLPYVFSSSGAFVTVANYTHDCAEPVITVTSVCGNPIIFTVDNAGGAMLMAQSYTITQGATVVASGTINIPAGDSTTITLPADINPYLPYVFSSSGAFVTVANYTHDCAEPVITVTSLCGDPIVFTVTNTGDDMLMPQTYTISQGATVVTTSTIDLPANASVNIPLTAGIDPYLPYVFSSSGAFVTIADYTHDCAEPVITVTSVCGNPIVFTVENSGADMLIDQPYTVTQGATVIASGTLNLTAGDTTTVTLPADIDPYLPYVFSNDGGFVTFSFTHDCADPIITVTSVCGNPIVFTVENTGGTMLIAQPYTVSQGVTLINSGTLNLPAGDSTTITLPTGITPYLAYVFSSSGAFVTVADYTHDCVDPVIAVTSVCGDPIVFTVTNTGGAMLIPQTYTVSQGAAVITTSTINLAAGGTTTVTLPGGIDPYLPYIFSSGGAFVTVADYTHDCADPAITVTSVCGDPIVFTISNAGGDGLLAQPYTITQGVTVVDSGTINVPAGGTTTVTLSGGIDPYLPYVFSSSGAFVTIADYTHDCVDPVIVVTSVCGDPIVFTVDNTGGDMFIDQPYTITQGATVITTGTLNLAAGGTTNVTLTAGINPYLPYVFSSSGAFVTVANYTHDCVNPDIVVTSVCGDPIVFTVTNNGGDVLIDQPYTVTQGAAVVDSGTLNLATGASTTITLTAGINPYLPYVFSNNGGYLTISYTHDCAEPVLTVTSVCGDPIVFTVTNTGGDMLIPQTYTISQGATVVTTSTIDLPANDSVDIPLTAGIDPYLPYVFSSSGAFVTVADYTHDCAEPVLTVTSVCGDPIVFTVDNTGGAMLIAQAYTVTQGATTITSGTLNLAAGGSTTVTLPAGIDPYLPYVFSSSGAFVTVANYTHDCAEPVLTVTSVCGDPIVFTVTNTGGDMLIPQTYTVSQGAVVVTTSTINIPGGSSTVVTLPAGIDPYAAYVFSSSGAFVTVADYTHDCADPVLTVTSVCGDPIVFTVTNTGGDMLIPQTYTVSQGAVIVTTGTINILGGSSTTVTLPTGIDPYAAYVFSSTGAFAPLADYTHDCANPVIVVTSVCGDPITFTVTNTGADMLVPQPYTVVSGGSPVASDDLNLTAGASVTVTLASGLNPYAPYLFSNNAGFVPINYTHDCPNPVLVVTSQCSNPIAFSVTNTGAPMIFAQPYTVSGGGSTVASGVLNLGTGASTVITLDGQNPYLPYSFSTGGFAGDYSMTQDCADPVFEVTGVCANQAAMTVTNVGGNMLASHSFTLTALASGTDITPSNPTFQLATGQQINIGDIALTDARGGVKFDTTTLGIAKSFTLNCAQATRLGESADFEPLSLEQTSMLAGAPTCGFSCPTFRIYHTDETGDWEIFRLDGHDAEQQQTFRRNLTYGEGENISDVSPSLSPNAEWIAFASNRDGNWEIYVASTSGDPSSVQRVTSNSFALDTHPVWGPNNFVVFETTRTGSWDLYMIDMSTGRVFPMLAPTLDSNETNASWSPDGSRIIFQSDRADENGVRKMQIYELTVGTGEIRRISDGTSTDVDPQFGNSSSQIVFRRYADAGERNHSVLWVMNVDGTNARQISDEAGDATNPAWSPSDRYIAYQSDLDGDLDIYAYEVATGTTRQISDNTIPDYAPSWTCDERQVFFSTDIMGQPDLFEAEVQPMQDGPIVLELDAERLTYELSNDIYPEQVPSNEVASREGQTAVGPFGQQTVYLRPDMTITEVDISIDEAQREDWRDPGVCPAS